MILGQDNILFHQKYNFEIGTRYYLVPPKVQFWNWNKILSCSATSIVLKLGQDPDMKENYSMEQDIILFHQKYNFEIGTRSWYERELYNGTRYYLVPLKILLLKLGQDKILFLYKYSIEIGTR